MIRVADENRTIVRTSRGLSVAGTRITLYALLDYLRAGWSPKMVQQWFGMTEEQMDDVTRYIEAHREQVEEEYDKVVAKSEENRRFWENEQRRRPSPRASDDLSQPNSRREKLRAWKARVPDE